MDEITDSVENGEKIEKASEAWKTSEKYGDLVKLVRLVRNNLEYRIDLHRILRKQYGDRITVYRGGRARTKGYTSVTPSRRAASRFAEWRGGGLRQFSIDTNKVLAAVSTMEMELIVRVMDLR